MLIWRFLKNRFESRVEMFPTEGQTEVDSTARAGVNYEAPAGNDLCARPADGNTGCFKVLRQN